MSALRPVTAFVLRGRPLGVPGTSKFVPQNLSFGNDFHSGVVGASSCRTASGSTFCPAPPFNVGAS
jgi:hypothetical protein